MKDDDNSNKNTHGPFAGRLPAGTALPIVQTKHGVCHVRVLPNGSTCETMSLELACSECFSGSNLAKILQPGSDYEQQVMRDLVAGRPAAPLSMHTSGGVTAALTDFIDALEPHLPWQDDDDSNKDDWCVSLQLEGASAVWAAIDLLLQILRLEQQQQQPSSATPVLRTKVAVACPSYHGPPSTCFGAKSLLWSKPHQLLYPAPQYGMPVDDASLLAEFAEFLAEHGHEIGVMLIEPQWGSSQAGLPWPQTLLQDYIQLARSYGIKIVADEIMCGLGRHGKGTLFVTEAWNLNVDGVTFGKAMGGGVYPLSGCVIRHGRSLLNWRKATVMQSHTYAGSSVRALMTATAVLHELPVWLPSIAKLGEEMEHVFRYITKMAHGMITCHGQGLMWGGVFTRNGQNQDAAYRDSVIAAFQKYCDKFGILPYYVPVGGFMVSPVIDIDVGTLYEMGNRFERVIRATMDEVDWVGSGDYAETASMSSYGSFSSFNVEEIAKQIAANDKCLVQLHTTRSCTKCTKFVCKDVRTHFLKF